MAPVPPTPSGPGPSGPGPSDTGQPATGQPATGQPAAERKGAERLRIDEADARRAPWRRWGPYLAERAWGTVREDYSADGEAWSYLPFDRAHAQTYRWNEDGMAGICDDRQLLCLALSLWNGRDRVLKERMFGLTGDEGNHGEDVKEYWWFLDATPTSSYLEWRYHYPQVAFPYDDLRATNRARSRLEPEYELLDTGAFDGDRYWVVTVRWAKAGPEDIVGEITVDNAGPDTEVLHVLPTAWFRNRWTWQPGSTVPRLAARHDADPGIGAIDIDDELVGEWEMLVGPQRTAGTGAGSGPATAPDEPTLLFCDNETNTRALYGTDGPAFPKDGIDRHVRSGEATVNPAMEGTKASAWYRVELPPGGTASMQLRLRRRPRAATAGAGAAPSAGATPSEGAASGSAALAEVDAVLEARRLEADEFAASVCPADASEEERRVMRQASAGMLWSKQFFHYDVERWLDGDPGQPPPPESRRHGRNADWIHFNAEDVISMPDPWEYPWFAAWDLAFHTVALAHLDAAFAKRQLILLDREWYMHPNGQLPAYEWNFSDVNPPVQAWAAMRVFDIDWRTRRRFDPDAAPDLGFLERVFHKLLLNFTWWINRKDAAGSNVFEGGFLGLDNIGLFDRSKPLPVAGRLEQSDATAWMAMYCLDLLRMALTLAQTNSAYEDVASKFFEHFTYIAAALASQGLWDKEDGFFYDMILMESGERLPVKVRSMVGVVPLFAVALLDPDLHRATPAFAARMDWFCANRPRYAAHVEHMHHPGREDRRLLSVVDRDRLVRVLAQVLDPDEMLSDHGLRSLSRRHRDYPFTLDLGGQTSSIDYEPAESTNYLFGGNSNWRGPVWMPLNFLAVEALRTYDSYFGADLTVEYPAGSGHRAALGEVADDLTRRLVSLWLPGPDGDRPIFGEVARLQHDPRWHDQLVFNEYFHGDNGAGLGASHQTGWTGLVIDLIAGRRLRG